MRYKIYFELENEELPIQYRRSIISFLQFALSQYNKEYYHQIYGEKSQIKPFTYSVFFQNPEFKEETVSVETKKFKLNLSIQDHTLANMFYEAFNQQKNRKFSLDKNSMTLRNITVIKNRQIKEEKILVRFISPLLARKKNIENRKEYYYSFMDEEFKDILKENIKEEMKQCGMQEEIAETFDIESLEPKKTVTKFYEKKIEGSLGIYRIYGDITMLQYLYEAGMGSKRSSGFGMFNLIEERQCHKIKKETSDDKI